MTTHRCFAYGSNLDQAQMRARCPGAKLIGPAELAGYELAFAGYSARWGGAVATVVPRRGSRVEGVLYALTPEDLAALDRFEGCPFSYQRLTEHVTDSKGRRRRVSLYVQTDAHSFRSPPMRYSFTIWSAYERYGFNRRALARAALVFQ